MNGTNLFRGSLREWITVHFFFLMPRRVFDSRNTPNPQMPQDAVFSISRGRATVLRPHNNIAKALNPEIHHASNPKGPPMMTRSQRRSFPDNSGMATTPLLERIYVIFIPDHSGTPMSGCGLKPRSLTHENHVVLQAVRKMAAPHLWRRL